MFMALFNLRRFFDQKKCWALFCANLFFDKEKTAYLEGVTFPKPSFLVFSCVFMVILYGLYHGKVYILLNHHLGEYVFIHSKHLKQA